MPTYGLRERLKFITTTVCGLLWPKHFDEWAEILEREQSPCIQAPRDHGKTYLFSVLYPLYRAGREVLDWGIISYTEGQVREKIVKIKQLIETRPAIMFLKPKNKDLPFNTMELSLSNGSRIVGRTFGQAGRGYHFKGLTIDDPDKDVGGINPDDQWDLYRSALVPMMTSDAQEIVTATPVYDGDMLSRIESNKAYKKYKYPAISSGKALWPERWSLEALQLRKEKIGEWAFASQYMLERIDPGTAPFKKEWIRYYEFDADTNPEPKMAKIMSIDPAISLKGDYTAIVVTGTDEKNKTYVLDYVRCRADQVTEIVNTIFDMAIKHQIHFAILETIGFQKLLKTWLDEEMRKRDYFFGIQEIKTQQKSKVARILALQPKIQSGSLLFRREHTELIEELLMFPRSKYDDLCFPGGTLIATPQGDRPIETLRVGDQVITPFGIRKVLNGGFTGIKEVVQVPHADLRATPNHPIYADGIGFEAVYALPTHPKFSRLRPWELLEWQYRKLLFSMEQPTVSWGLGNTTLAKRVKIKSASVPRDFMWRCGSFITRGQFLKAFTFITKTVTLSITILETWSAYQQKSIGACLRGLTWKRCELILKGIKTSAGHGTNQTKGVLGIEPMLRNNGTDRFHSDAYVLSAAHILRRGIATLNAVQQDASREIGALKSSANTVISHTRLQKLEPLDDASDVITAEAVYNLTVDKDHCYYANGYLVHNCDALAFQNGYWVTPDKLPEPIRAYSYDWWSEQITAGPSDFKKDLFSDMGSA